MSDEESNRRRRKRKRFLWLCLISLPTLGSLAVLQVSNWIYGAFTVAFWLASWQLADEQVWNRNVETLRSNLLVVMVGMMVTLGFVAIDRSLG